MGVFQRQTRIEAPLERVWAFHSTVDGLKELTPSMANLRVEDLRIPDRDVEDQLLTDADGMAVLVAGTEMDLSVRPIPFGSRQRWTSVITEREAGESEAYFVDEMRDGPMPGWKHTHTFTAAGEETILNDRVVFRTPFGRPVDRIAALGMWLAFLDRHRKTREILGQA